MGREQNKKNKAKGQAKPIVTTEVTTNKPKPKSIIATTNTNTTKIATTHKPAPKKEKTPPIVGKAQEMIFSLGNSSDVIAASLIEMGYTGSRYMKKDNPLAIFLMEMLAVPVAVGLRDLTVDGYTFTSPDAVKDFVENFDELKYPELLRREKGELVSV